MVCSLLSLLNGRFDLIEAFPLAFLHVNASVVQKGDAFVFEQPSLHVRASESKAACEAPVLEHHAVARDDSGFRIGVQLSLIHI